MKEQVQETGVRKYFGDDFILLQNELIEAITALYNDHGNFIIQGCEVSDMGATWQVNAGVVLLRDDAGDNPKLCRFAGGIYSSATAQIYLTQAMLDKDDVPAYGRIYKDAATKNIVVEFIASAGTSLPAQADYITITKASGGASFLDAIQNSARRFVTDALINTWNAKFDEASGVPLADTKTGSNYTASVNVEQNVNIAKDRSDLDITQFTSIGATKVSNYTLHTSANFVFSKLTCEIIGSGTATINVIHGAKTICSLSVTGGTQSVTRYFLARRLGDKWIKLIDNQATSPII
jgi:hypothetical protein